MIDTHSHINFPDLITRVDVIVNDALKAGVSHIVIPTTDIDTITTTVEVIEKYENLFMAVGWHPEAANLPMEDMLEVMKKAIVNKKTRAIGEIGLDYFHGIEDVERQRLVFGKCLELSIDSNLPSVIHTREAFMDTIRIMDEKISGREAVFHCFTGSIDEAKKVLDRGWFISYTGMITYKKNDSLREVVKYVPLDCMMLETDAPYLAPEGYRGQVNEPKHVVEIAKCVAEIKGLSYEVVDDVTSKNAREFFKI